MNLPHDHRQVLPTPFHERVAAANELNEWEPWKGYTTPCAYQSAELEYFAFRNTTGVLDLTPMTKHRVTGPDATAYFNRLVTRDVTKQAVGQVMYCCWCDDAGQVLDDGTLFRLGEQDYRLCSAERHLDWMQWSALGFDVAIEDETADVAALAVQGPTSCATLRAVGLAGVEGLKPFRFQVFPFDGAELLVSRTGFTGDLGFELWIAPAHAERLWDALMTAGRAHGIRPAGLEALEIARIEAGFLQAGVDFVPAAEAVRGERSRSPFELGLGWLVHLTKPVFNGRGALLREKANGSRYRFVKLDIDGNKPANNSFVFDKRGRQVGTVTSATWSPTTKRNIAFASLKAPWGEPSDTLVAEIYYLRELKWTRVMANARVIEGPIFDPERRHATPARDF